jgi:polygalacturonase
LGVEFPFPSDLPDWVGRRIRQPQDLNTDGIDPMGTDIWIHDCIVQNADDSIAVKPPPGGNETSLLHGRFHYNCTRNVTIENMVLTGFGASIGSVGPTMFNACVDQVVFRNISMPGTGKGIYIKSDASSCLGGNSSQITNVLYVSMKQTIWKERLSCHSITHSRCLAMKMCT